METDEVIVASVAVPEKYRARSTSCWYVVGPGVLRGTGTRSHLTVDGVEVTPSVGPTQCTDSGWAFRNRQWSFPPASHAGP